MELQLSCIRLTLLYNLSDRCMAEIACAEPMRKAAPCVVLIQGVLKRAELG